MAERRRVVIAGGGYAGVTLAKALDDSFDVVLVERGDRFYHNVGAMRAYADPSLYSRLFIPYSHLLRRGRVVQDEVIAVVPGGVRTRDGSYEADLVAVATGSRHRLPFKSAFTDTAAFLAEARQLSAAVAAAGSVAILGDGPVAVELAGEIRHRYPDVPLTLVSPGNRLLPQAANPRLGEKLLGLLQQRGVRFEWGRTEASADVAIPAFGSAISVPCLGAPGRVPVDGWFRVAGSPGVFALGDAADCGEPPLTFLARRQALHLASQWKGNPKPYRITQRVPMSVPLGPEVGATQLPLPGAPVVGSWLTSRLKGKDLFIANNWSLLGNPPA